MQGQVRQMPAAEIHPQLCVFLLINDKVKCRQEEILELHVFVCGLSCLLPDFQHLIG